MEKPKTEPEVFFRYRNAKLNILGDDTITFEITDVDKILTHWCFYPENLKQTLFKAIQNDKPTNMLVGRYFVEPQETSKVTVIDYLEEVWIES